MANQENDWLSEKPIPVEERLIFALDVSSIEEAKALGILYPDDKDSSSIALPLDAVKWDELLRLAKGNEKAAKQIVRDMSSRLKAAIGDHRFGALPDGSSYSWKKQNRKEFVTAASSFRVLRHHERKES